MRLALYNLHFATLGGGERRTALLAAHLAQAHDVAIFSALPLERERIGDLFGIDLSRVDNVVLPETVDGQSDAILAWRPDVFVNNSHGSRLPCPVARGIYMCMFPEGSAEGLEGYAVMTANSAFTAEWIRQRWQRAAEVVYSAVEPMGPPAAKAPIILNVARFQADTGTNHFKQQDLLVACFARLRSHVDTAWTLHLVGTIGSQPADRVYAEQLRERAAAAGAVVHFGLPQAALRDLYRRATLYWHATGSGDPAGTDPARQEHFGMTIVEAMSAGAVPFAFRGGGPCETIEHAGSGFLWATPDELLDHTRELIARPDRCRTMAAASIARSRRFDKQQYLQRMDALVAAMLAA